MCTDYAPSKRRDDGPEIEAIQRFWWGHSPLPLSATPSTDVDGQSASPDCHRSPCCTIDANDLVCGRQTSACRLPPRMLSRPRGLPQRGTAPVLRQSGGGAIPAIASAVLSESQVR